MEEELNEHDIEGRLYAMLHHVDETQSNVKEASQYDEQTLEGAPRSTIRRYWRTSGDITKAIASKDAQLPIKTTPKDPPIIPTNTTVLKEETRKSPAIPPSTDPPVFQLPPQNVKNTNELIGHQSDNPVIVESSDEDEVIEVKLPPKPTITIESSDEDELQIIKPESPAKIQKLPDRPVSASPVPSVVSSVSDEFIRGDCIALNISSRRTDNPSFDFSLHGSDLLDQSTPLKKKKKKKSKDALTSTPIVTQKSAADECFATPKSKAKNKKRKSYTILEKSVPNADVYDSDSNQSLVETNKNASYIVSDKSLPSTDVYESDSSYSEVVKEKNTIPIGDVSSDSNISLDKPLEETPKIPAKNKHSQNETITAVPVVDLTQNDSFTSIDASDICESIVMGNVSGFPESDHYGDENLPQNDISKFVSTKIPPILNEDLDFDNLKGKNKVCKRRHYSLTTLRADMEKFYNESWGGENFNHREIQKNMSRDKSLWAIDPKDRVPTSAKRRVTCNYCNRPGHRDDTCRMKPPVCYMCGHTGHFEPRCPRKICVNCGSPNHIYSSMCRNCCSWGTIRCHECGQNGHPASHCPDIWRRYHNTIDLNVPLERSIQTKKHVQLYCSGCTRRGHLIHTCRSTLPFSGLPINSPYVCLYRPVYSSLPQDTHSPNESNNSKNIKALNARSGQDSPMPPAVNPRLESNKRQSKSPTVHETHVNKKRNLSVTDEVDPKRNTKSPVNNNTQRKTSLSGDDNNKSKRDTNKTPNVDSVKTQSLNSQKALDFIAVGSTNFDKRGQIIQDNEVSDTSDVVTSSRIYVTNEFIKNLKSNEGEEWLKEIMSKHNVSVECTETNSFLSIKGKLGDQEAFQAALREWSNVQNEETTSHNDSNVSNENKNDSCDLSLIPKNRNNLLRQLSKALNSLKEEIGDPKDLYKELTFFQNRHQQLLNQKTVSPKQVTNNRCNINLMLKKLNMVLLGQAGLADGSQHLSELYLFHEQLMNSTQKFIPPELRKEIGHHYYNIFAAIPRNDYVELLNKFYQNSTSFKRKKKERSFNLNPQINRFNKSINSIPHQQMNVNVNKQIFGDKVPNNSIRQKLIFYHQRVLKTRPNGAVLKRTRADLMRRLHSFITSFFNKERVSSKSMRKIRRAQEQAQTFLANV